jgi:ribonuclease P protein component
MPGGLARLKKRADFLRVAAARRAVARPGVVLQAAHQPIGMAGAAIRVGFTASRKVGDAVVRNRAKRRLRAAADAVLPRVGRTGTDYVLIARAGTSDRRFADLVGDIEAALHRIARDTPLRRGGEIRNGG